MKVHLRILTCFLEIVENDEEEVIDYLSNRIRKIIEEKGERRKADCRQHT